MSKSAGPVAKLSRKLKAQNNAVAFGSHNPQFGARRLSQTASCKYPNISDEVQPRDGGLHPLTHADDLATRELQAIYNRYVAVYDKVSITRKRKSYYRRAATEMVGLNEVFTGRSQGGSLVERILRTSNDVAIQQ